MEFGGSKFLHSLVLGALLVISQLVSAILTEDATKSWTFNIPGVSFISFSPVYNSDQDQRISLQFRTRNPNGLLFCHYLKDLDAKELDRINYKLCGELKYGLFKLDYRLMQYHEDGLSLGKALNDDQWHTMDLYINTTSGALSVTIDRQSQSSHLKSYTRQDFKSLLDWTDHSSAIYFGGTDPNTLFSDDIYPHFAGCMRDIRYRNKNGGHVEVPISMIEGVREGCHDLCVETDPCHHGGICVNMYTNTVCDCFGGDYQGEFCSDLGPTTLTLRGYEWITYSLHEYEENILTDQLRFSLEFKTSRGSGVLFYAAGGAPYHSHVTASVHAGIVKVSMGFGEEDIEVSDGIGLDDYRWHNLTISHMEHSVHVYLDGRKQSRRILGDVHHLSLDPQIFVGGGNSFVVTRGLQVTQNFVGCVKNVYVNEVSVLHEMAVGNAAAVYNGGGATWPHYMCEEVVNIPISFPNAASMLMLDSTQNMKNGFEVEFDFKTVRTEAILFFCNLIDMDTSIEINFGYIEIWLRQGRPMLVYVPSMRYVEHSQNLTIPMVVNNNVWHTMDLSFVDGLAKLKVDGSSISSHQYSHPLEIRQKIVIGFGLRSYKDSDGFVGCIRNLKVHGRVYDALDLMETDAVFGLVIDGCNITDYCQGSSMCEHGGHCLSDWTSMACDCSETHYTGKACHFSNYKRTCDEYYQSGVTNSGVTLIDLDGPGPLEPTHVHCTMGYELDYEFFGKTEVIHNFAENTTVRGYMMRDRRILISYRNFNQEQLMKLTAESAWCEQYLRYDCKHSPIRLGMQTWFKAANGEMIEYLGTDETMPGYCTCGLTDSCPGDRKCICDNDTRTLEHDEGYNRINRQLPLTEVTAKQRVNPLDMGMGNLTLGPLVCWGNKNERPSEAVTFSNETAYLMSHPWKSGDLRISFRTHRTRAIVLYQTGTLDNINYFFIAVTSEFTVKFYFRWGNKKLEVDITSPVPVNNGQWHQASIATDQHNVRCMLDMRDQILPIPSQVPRVTAFTGVLYIGGIPNEIEKDPIVAEVPGIVGCMRGLAYNRRGFPLTDLIDTSTEAVIKAECMASCWPNPCRNGATCVERWGAHQCICVNQWAHSGHNCEIDINTDAVTFMGTPDSHLHFKKPMPNNLLDTSIIFSFRTFQQSALLLYLHDNYNNFLQVELQEGDKVVAKFNRYNQIYNQTKTVFGLDDGQWKQVVVNNSEGYIKVVVNVDNEPTRNSYRKLNLVKYKWEKPFTSPETVRPIRTRDQPEPVVHVYVGGVPKAMSLFPTLWGCMRGLKIGETIFGLQKAALKTNVSRTCEDGCDARPCKNDGICQEQWQDQRFKCDCSVSEFAGPTCSTEASGLYSSQSILQYQYDPPFFAKQTKTERLELIFQVDSSTQADMVLVFIYSERWRQLYKERRARYVTHDFLLVYLDRRHGVFIKMNQGYGIHGVGKPGQYADGKPHQLIYRRTRGEMILTVRSEGDPKYRMKSISIDEQGIGRVTVPDNALDELDTIMIGGILPAQFTDIPDITDFLTYSNFSGCLSEVTFYPSADEPFAIRPLKDLRDNLTTVGDLVTHGPYLEVCNTRNHAATTTYGTPPVTWRPTEKPLLTFPPWAPGPADTIFIGPPRMLPSPNTTAPTTISTTSATETEQLLESLSKAGRDDRIIGIALSVVAFLLIIAIIIAILLVRTRQRQRKAAERKKRQDMELKQPLNDVLIDNHLADNHQNQNYLARLDEFSMVSATLGARPVKNDGTSTFKPSPDDNHMYSEVPISDEVEPDTYISLYNQKKKRPASSISEVLEEMERQRNDDDADPEDLETLKKPPQRVLPEKGWDPSCDRSPLSCPNEDFRHMPIPEDFIYNMLPPTTTPEQSTLDGLCGDSLHDPNPADSLYGDPLHEPLQTDSFTSTENAEDDAENDADNESDTPSPPLVLRHSQDPYNGDSGYEAESKPDDEDDETLMDGCYRGNNSYQGELTSNTPESQTFKAFPDELIPQSPSDSSDIIDDPMSMKHAIHDNDSIGMVDNNSMGNPLSGTSSQSDNMSEGNVFPTTPESKVSPTPPESKVMNYVSEYRSIPTGSVITNGHGNT